MVIAAIVIDGLTKEYSVPSGNGAVTALDDVNLAIEDNEFFVILGPSGCGKSTLLNIMAGFIKPSAGRVSVDGALVTAPGPDRAVVFQDHALFSWRTVRRNVECGPEVRGLPKAQRREIASGLLELVGLDDFEDRYPSELSGGMQQRVGLARALATDPDVLLMDEPFGSLDAQTRRLMQTELLRIWDTTKKTVVFVTHSVIEALVLADRLVVMTARPGTIKATVEVPLERPRDRTSAAFVEYEKGVDDLIEDEVRASLQLMMRKAKNTEL